MKNKNNKIVAGLAATVILALSFGSTSAMYGQWHWGGQGKWMHHWKWMWNWHNEWKEGHSPAKMIEKIKKQDVSAIEIDLLKKQYEEELMANELYMSFYEKYWVETFKNIANSESKHMEAVKALLNRYDIETPTNYDHIQSLYDKLKSKGSLSLKDALEVWIKIEIVDIDDIIKAIKTTDNDDIKTIFVNIGGASYNHMRGFVKALKNNNLTTDIDYSDYINENDINTKGPIKLKLAEKLESEGIELPEWATSEAIKKKCAEKKWNKKHWEDKEHSENKKNWKNIINNELKNKYKKAINSKYWEKIAKISDEKLKIIIKKIDVFLEKNISEKNKIVLIALKEIIEEKLNDNEINIDELLN